MIDDKNLSKAVQTKFFLGRDKGDKDQQTLTKQSVTSLSDGLTSIQNAFNQVKAYTNNTAKIQKAVIAARVVSKKESSIEKTNIAPIQSAPGQISTLFPKLTKSLEELQKSLEKLELDQSGTGGGISSQGGGMGGLLAKIAAGAVGTAAVGAIGYSMLSPDEAEAKTPSPEPQPAIETATPEPQLEPEVEQPIEIVQVQAAPEPESDISNISEYSEEPESTIPNSSEIAEQAEENVVERKAKSEESGSRQAQRAVAEDRQAEQLSESIEKTTQHAVPVTKLAAPPGASDWSTKLSSYIGKSIQSVEQKVSSFQAGGGGGGGDMGGAPGDVSIAEGGGGGGAANMELAITKAGIADPITKAQIMAQTAHESGNFKYTSEIWGPTAAQRGYEGRKDLGNVNPGDGSRYRGRGFLQTTGRANYAELSKATGVDFVNSPEMLSDPKYASASAMVWFKKRWGRISDWSNTKGVTKVVNGGYNGLADREAKFDKYVKIYKGGGSVGGAEGGAGYTPGASSGPIQRSGEAVQGMGFETAAAATRQAGVRGTNGNLDSGQLEGIGVGSLVAQPSAAKAFKAMRAAAAKEGINLSVNSAYRSYQRQVELKKQKGKMAATPGRSNHGWGLAFDISGLQKGNKPYQWMKANAERFGIFGPLAKPYEIWHWEYRGGGSLRPATVPVSSPAEQQQAMGPSLRSPAGAAINNAAAATPKGECKCDEPTIIPVAVGGGAPSPTDYLKGTKPTKTSGKYNVNTSEDYRVYFNAA